MALIKLIEETGQGFRADNAYWIITEISLNKFTKRARVILWAFKDNQARDNRKQGIQSLTYEFYEQPQMETDPLSGTQVKVVPSYDELFSIEKLQLKGNNPFKVVYEWLKTLTIFKDSVDIES